MRIQHRGTAAHLGSSELPTLLRVPLDSDYLLTLLREVTSGLGVEQGSGATVSLEATDEGLTLVLVVVGRRLVHLVADAVDHYEPDGADPRRHASWLVQLFDEEAR